MSYTPTNWQTGDIVSSEKLNKMEEGIANAHSEEYIVAETDEWLEENITQETGYVLDRSLQSANAAAPADIVGDIQEDLSDAKNAISEKAPVIINNASGDIASFTDGADDMPVKQIVAQVEPVQDLHGYDNPWPAGGNKNKFDKDTLSQASAYPTSYNNYWYSDPIILKPNTGYVIDPTSKSSLGLSEYYVVAVNTDASDPTSMTSDTLTFYYVVNAGEPKTITFTTGATGAIRFGVVNRGSSIKVSALEAFMTINYQLEEGSTPTAWTPYSNVCPISGHTGLTVNRTGVNVWDEEWELGTLDPSTGKTAYSSSIIRSKNFIPIKGGASYYSRSNSNVYFTKLFYDASKNFISGANIVSKNAAFVTPDNAVYMKFRMENAYGTTYNHDISINYPSTDTSYHAYTGTTLPITWETEAGTVYGGTLDVVSGKMYVTSAKYVFDGTQTDILTNWRSNADSVGWLYPKSITPGINAPLSDSQIPNLIADKLKTISYAGSDGIYYATIDCISIVHHSSTYGIAMRSTDTSLTTVSAINAFLAQNPVTVVYELAQPVEYTITANELNTLYGTNNVWTDVGEVSVDYPADTKLYIDGLTAPDEDMIANANIASGKYFVVNNQLYLSTAAIAAGASIIPGTNCTATNLAEALNAINT